MSADGREDVENYVAGLKVVELREELKKRGVTHYGVKSVLADRLVAAMKAEAEGPTGQEGSQLQEVKEDGKQEKELQPGEEEAREPSAHAQETEDEVGKKTKI